MENLKSELEKVETSLEPAKSDLQSMISSLNLDTCKIPAFSEEDRQKAGSSRSFSGSWTA